jgi:serpin B
MAATDMRVMLEAGSTLEVELQMPRFKVETIVDPELKGALQAMGMRLAFTPDADFSPMSGTRDLFVSKVIQKAVIEVDEVGTEAAAATAMMLRTLSVTLKEDTVTLRLDRPFFYAIVDEQTNLVIFSGVLNDPSNQGEVA